MVKKLQRKRIRRRKIKMETVQKEHVKKVMNEVVQAIETANEIEARNHNSEETTDKLEIIDSNTADIKYLFNDLIDNTGIIEYIRLRFKIGLTPTILETLSKNKTLLTENNIYWEINNPCKDYIELTLEQDK